MLIDECRLMTWNELVESGLVQCGGTNVYGFGVHKYRMRLGTREELRSCNTIQGMRFPGLLDECLVVVVRIDDFTKISMGVRDPATSMNPFELKIHRALIETGPIEFIGFKFDQFPNQHPEQLAAGLVIPMKVLQRLPGGVLRLPFYGIEVGTENCVFPDISEISVARTLEELLSSQTYPNGQDLGGVYGTWFYATSEIKNIWWMYDSIKGAIPLTTVRIDGSNRELIRYTRWYDPVREEPKFSIESISVDDLQYMTDKEQTEIFRRVGLFRTENEAIASGSAHNGLLDYRMKHLQHDKMTEDMTLARRKIDTDDYYRRKEREDKEREAADKLKERPAQLTDGWMKVVKGFVETACKIIAGGIAAVKLYQLINN